MPGPGLSAGVFHGVRETLVRVGLMATRTKTAPAEVVEEPVDVLGPEGVRSLEPEPVEEEVEGVEEVGPPRGDMTTTHNFYGATSTGVNEVEEVEPEIVEGAEPTYRIRLTTDVDSVFIGIDFLLPPMKKDVLYEVNQHVYDYLMPKGLIQGK
jgi:hypothetical protein